MWNLCSSRNSPKITCWKYCSCCWENPNVDRCWEGNALQCRSCPDGRWNRLIQAPVRFSTTPAQCNSRWSDTLHLHYTLVATKRASSGHNLLPLAIWPKICISAAPTKSFNAHILGLIWQIEAFLNLIIFTLTIIIIIMINDHHHPPSPLSLSTTVGKSIKG